MYANHGTMKYETLQYAIFYIYIQFYFITM